VTYFVASATPALRAISSALFPPHAPLVPVALSLDELVAAEPSQGGRDVGDGAEPAVGLVQSQEPALLDRERDGLEDHDVLGLQHAHLAELTRRETTLASVLDDDQVVPQTQLERPLRQYERGLRLICLAVHGGVEDVTLADLMLEPK
jgi:hypothetical protein